MFLKNNHHLEKKICFLSSPQNFCTPLSFSLPPDLADRPAMDPDPAFHIIHIALRLCKKISSNILCHKFKVSQKDEIYILSVYRCETYDTDDPHG